MGAFLFHSGFAHADNVITKRCSKKITWLLLSRSQGNKPHSPEPSGTFRKLHPEPTPAHTGTLSWTYTSTHRNPPEPSGTCLRNLRQHTPEPSGTFRTLPEPTPAHTGTLRNIPEPSGTCSCDPHRHTPELIWAEDPISLHCWGKKWTLFPLHIITITLSWFLGDLNIFESLVVVQVSLSWVDAGYQLTVSKTRILQRSWSCSRSDLAHLQHKHLPLCMQGIRPSSACQHPSVRGNLGATTQLQASIFLGTMNFTRGSDTLSSFC